VKTKKIFKLKILFLFYVFVLLGTLEVYLRFEVKNANDTDSIKLSKNIFYRVQGGYRLRPNVSQKIEGIAELSFLVKSNSNGLRDKEHFSETPENTIRIITIGDSFTFGWGVNVEDSYPKVMEKELSKYGKYEVINAGFPGNSFYGDLEALKCVLEKYETDFVLIGLHGGDLKESIDNLINSKLEDEDMVKLRSGDLKESIDGVINSKPEDKKIFIRIKDYMKMNTLSYGFIIKYIRQNKALSMLLIKVGLIESLDKMQDERIMEFKDEINLKFFEKHLSECVDICVNKNVVPILFYVPNRWDVAPSRFSSGENLTTNIINGIIEKIVRKK